MLGGACSMQSIMIDPQFIFNGAVTLAAFFGGWVLNRITMKLDNLDTDVRKTREEYVSKIDYKDDMQEIRSNFKATADNVKRIFDKLDGKADK